LSARRPACRRIDRGRRAHALKRGIHVVSHETRAGDRIARRVVIVGCGASGGLVAIQLLRRGGTALEVTVVEPRAELAVGAAFSTRDPWHRLNVPAITMSALPDDPDHFRRWLDAPPETFPSRADYGRYLRTLLAEAIASSAASFHHVPARAVRLAEGDGTIFVSVEGEIHPLHADAVVLATGNELPAVPGSLAAWDDDPRFVADPWARTALDPFADGEVVAILGTGHTALDLAASVLRRLPASVVIAISRRGELPRAHEDPWRPRLPQPIFGVAEFRAFHDPLVEAEARVRAHGADWRRALDSLRPIHRQLWLAMDDDLRRRFVGEWRRTWEVHRSRVPADVMRDVEAWTAQRRFIVRAGTIGRLEAEGARLRIHVTAPGDASTSSFVADRILLATGPDEHATANPFLAAACADGILRPDPLGLGLDVDPVSGRTRDAAGSTAQPIWAVGPLRRGAVWESIAIPEIRDQAADLAERLLGTGT
jgi:uncharacterized NAD(P)/FAD-binding protein YdhS